MAGARMVADAIVLLDHYIEVLLEIEKRLCPGTDACFSRYSSILAMDREKRTEAAEKIREARNILEEAKLALARELKREVLRELAEERAQQLVEAERQRLDGDGKLKLAVEG
ncbi:hypothetical protein [Aeropyrum globular virus 1]|uniref:hypothetical protein n=1 Tax=Aeropyrum globular virus 1 TaxID=1932713 RepID=UPI000C7EFAC9|nr:hypothetical protein C1186_gp17 [Aeropyrum globular virus 1]BBC20943.1 hypothetical protein [Aeropyrum globular virus 1]